MWLCCWSINSAAVSYLFLIFYGIRCSLLLLRDGQYYLGGSNHQGGQSKFDTSTGDGWSLLYRKQELNSVQHWTERWLGLSPYRPIGRRWEDGYGKGAGLGWTQPKAGTVMSEVGAHNKSGGCLFIFTHLGLCCCLLNKYLLISTPLYFIMLINKTQIPLLIR